MKRRGERGRRRRRRKEEKERRLSQKGKGFGLILVRWFFSRVWLGELLLTLDLKDMGW